MVGWLVLSSAIALEGVMCLMNKDQLIMRLMKIFHFFASSSNNHNIIAEQVYDTDETGLF